MIRGGFGIFADQFPSYFIAALVQPGSVRIYADRAPGHHQLEWPGTGPVIAANSAAAFKSGFANGATLAQLQAAVAPSPLRFRDTPPSRKR